MAETQKNASLKAGYLGLWGASMPDPDILQQLAPYAAAGYAAKDAFTRLLGPTADYLGEGLRDLVKHRKERFAEILENAVGKVGDKINEPGRVPPRVFRDIINDGSWRDDDISTEYFGGVCAASRSDIDRDDSHASYSSLISRLSSYQLRAHYILYSAFHSQYSGTLNRSGDKEFWCFRSDDVELWSCGSFSELMGGFGLYIPFDSYISAMDFSAREIARLDSITYHALHGLQGEGLLGKFAVGDSDYLTGLVIPVEEEIKNGGLVFNVSVLGIQLFLVAYGKRWEKIELITEHDTGLSPWAGIVVPQRTIQIKAVRLRLL